MTSGPIARIARQRVVSGADRRLPGAWVHVDVQRRNVADGRWLRRGDAPRVGAGDGPVLVMLGSDGDALEAALDGIVRSGRRVYVLVGPDWGSAGQGGRLASAGTVLLRRVPEVPASALHTPDGASLWLGGGYRLTLDSPQASALRHVFLRRFWHDATAEAWSGGRTLMWQAAGARPFDVPEIPPSAPLRIEAPSSALDAPGPDAAVHLTDGIPPGGSVATLWLPPSAEHHDRLARLARQGTRIRWRDRGLPDLQVTPHGGEVLLPGVTGRLRVRLTAAQAQEVAALLEVAAPWTFRVDLPIASPDVRRARFWLAGEGDARRLDDEQHVALPDVPAAHLRDLPKGEPTDWPAPDPLALTTRYRWTVVPPTAPKATTTDALVGHWAEVDDAWRARIDALRTTLDAADSDRGRIGRAFARLVSAMLGFERSQGALRARVEELGQERPSRAGPSGAPELLRRLSEVEADAQRLVSDLAEAERTEAEAVEREKQHAAWASRVQTAKQRLTESRQALAEREQRRVALGDELGSIEGELPGADKKSKKDLKARQRKLSDELRGATKDIARLRGEIERFEEEATEDFAFRPPPKPPRKSGRGGRFVPKRATTKRAPAVPPEALPAVGELRASKGQRYLVIQTWEELDAGEREADRLSARLVAPEDA